MSKVKGREHLLKVGNADGEEVGKECLLWSGEEGGETGEPGRGEDGGRTEVERRRKEVGEEGGVT